MDGREAEENRSRQLDEIEALQSMYCEEIAAGIMQMQVTAIAPPSTTKTSSPPQQQPAARKGLTQCGPSRPPLPVSSKEGGNVAAPVATVSPRTDSLLLRLTIQGEYHAPLVLDLTLHDQYPSQGPPAIKFVEGLVGQVRAERAEALVEKLHDLYEKGGKEVCLFQWVESLRSLSTALSTQLGPSTEDLTQSAGKEGEKARKKELKPEEEEEQAFDPKVGEEEGTHCTSWSSKSSPHGDQEDILIVTGDQLIDRKSVFVAHVAKVHSVAEVERVQAQLMRIGKVARATHNIMAYRLKCIRNGVEVLVADNDDDGEHAAGSNLARLLDLRGVTNVVVVVSRWYGGIQLGPDRFKHINKCAQLTLAQAGFVTK